MTTLLNEPLRYKGRGKNPNSHANLIIGRAKLAEKRANGELTNPAGYSLASRLKHSLDKPLKKPAADAPAGEQIVYSTLKGAIELVPVAFREAWDRTEGKVPDKTLPVLGGDTINNFVFILPDGTKLTPKALIQND